MHVLAIYRYAHRRKRGVESRIRPRKISQKIGCGPRLWQVNVKCGHTEPLSKNTEKKNGYGSLIVHVAGDYRN